MVAAVYFELKRKVAAELHEADQLAGCGSYCSSTSRCTTQSVVTLRSMLRLSGILCNFSICVRHHNCNVTLCVLLISSAAPVPSKYSGGRWLACFDIGTHNALVLSPARPDTACLMNKIKKRPSAAGMRCVINGDARRG